MRSRTCRFQGALAVLFLLLGLWACDTPRIRKVTPEGEETLPDVVRSEATPIEASEPEVLPEDLEKLIAESKDESWGGFRFLAGDRVEITVFGYPDLKMQTRLPRDLKLRFPLIGEVDLVGKTIRQVEEEIRTRLEADHIFEAQVTVTPLEFAERTVFISGSVNKNGAYDIPPFGSLTLVQLISLAGGFSEDAELDRILLIRDRAGRERRMYRVSYTFIQEKGNLELDVALKPGDTILVPTQQRVYVLGSVNHPGGFSVGPEGLTASKAVALAQGFTRLAAPNSTVVIREGKDGRKVTFKVPLSTILDFGGSEELDLDLRPGDVVFVPESLF